MIYNTYKLPLKLCSYYYDYYFLNINFYFEPFLCVGFIKNLESTPL